MFQVGLVLSLFALSAAVEMPQVSNTTQCVYVPGTHMFSCQFGRRHVECSAVTNFTTTTYHLFGIGRLGSMFTTKTPMNTYTYTLYPRALDNTTYVTSTDFTLYYGPNFIYNGIRIVNEACYTDLVGLFNMIDEYHTVTVGTTPVDFIGEILINDATVQKRWLWGYGYGLGWPYFGWGGWGGLGFGGLGYGFGWPYMGFWGK
jgi:hypothetical protein